MQLKELWNFMQVDMAADNFEAEMRKSPNRQKLLKRRNLLLELQNNNKRIDSEIAVMQDRLEAVRDEAARLEALLKTALEELQARARNRQTGCFRLLDRTLSNVRRILAANGGGTITLKVIQQASGMMML